MSFDKRLYNQNRCFEEMLSEDCNKWFSYSQKKFLSNIDTFYYSVKFKNDFRLRTKDANVERLRRYFKHKYEILFDEIGAGDLYLKEIDKLLVLRPVTFSRFYNTCLSYPEYFDIFLASVVPKAADGTESVTAELIVQVRSYMLWSFGIHAAFENSFRFVQALADYFGLEIDFVQENRIDYCWHTNYFRNPEYFFSPENFYKMRVDRFKSATYVTNKVGTEDYEIDYVALGKRSDKVFLRIYQKTREVIEQNYKPWFFLMWKMQGLISEYDFYVYERCYEKKNWFYRYYVRLEFYLKHGSDTLMKDYVSKILTGKATIGEDTLIRLVDELTPKLNLVVNVEYQTMRRHSKSYDLVPFKNHSDKGVCERIYTYLDNRKVIMDYLTDKVFRMVEKDGNQQKSRRPMCDFWKRLRSTRCIDVKWTSDEVKLIRQYNRKLNTESMRKRLINSAVTLGIYQRGYNFDSPLQDCFEALLKLNDNDIHSAMRYKRKQLRLLNKDELAEVYETSEIHDFEILDVNAGEILSNQDLNNICQDLGE